MGLLIRAAFVTSTLLSVTFCWAESDSNILSLRANVVRVWSDGNSENGFGFIIAARSGSIYVVTAYHLVAVNDPGSPAPAIFVAFFTDQGKAYKASVLKQKRDHDLALIEVRTPPDFAWDHKCLSRSEDSNRGTNVWFIGRNSSWFVPVLNGAIDSERPDADSWLDVTMEGLQPGSSGAPLVSKTGIVGMVKSGESTEARVLSVEYIKNAVRDWGYPWDLGVTDALGGQASQIGALQNNNSTVSNDLASSNGRPDSRFCSDLNVYIDAAHNGFRSLKGQRDPDSSGEAFNALRGVTGFNGCEVWIYKDHSLSPSATCDAIGSDMVTLRNSIQSCLGVEWPVRTTTNGNYDFEGPNRIDVRLNEKTGGRLEIWVDSPSK